MTPATPTARVPFNMHMHTHFSFNAEYLSPTQLVQEAVRRELYALAICDFDVLDGLEELYGAADQAGLRSAAGMETRVYFPEYGDKVINSPGEPGVYYFMGMGFARVPSVDTAAGRILAELRVQSAARNRDMIARINAAFPEMAINYDKEVLPLTPSGNATERHIVQAYIAKVAEVAKGNAAAEKEIWNKVMKAGDRMDGLLKDKVALQNAVRSSLMKSGSVGYAQPDSSTFPAIDHVIEMMLGAGAMPMATWLNGLSDGEKDIENQLQCLRAKGVAALNIVPDRNWNIKDPADRDRKVAELHRVVAVAERMELPVNVGTELNSFGLPFVDNFEAEPMLPHYETFFKGANVSVGQARLARYAGYSYCGDAAKSEFGANLAAKNAFFAQVGMLPCPDTKRVAELIAMDDEKAYAVVRDSAKAGEWKA